MVEIPGVDYSFGRPGAAALKAAGKKFACRYLSGGQSRKDLTRAEADELQAHGIAIVSNWETSAGFMLGGHGAGVRDALIANSQAADCGAPAGAPIYFSCDIDANPQQRALVMAYLDGAASILGRGRVGVYGSYYVCHDALNGHATYAWQTRAWSGGQWEPRAHIRQFGQVKIGGADCDLDTAYFTDFGQWHPPVAPPVVAPVAAKPAVDLTSLPAPSKGPFVALTDKQQAQLIRDAYLSQVRTDWMANHWARQVSGVLAAISAGDKAQAAALTAQINKGIDELAAKLDAVAPPV